VCGFTSRGSEDKVQEEVTLSTGDSDKPVEPVAPISLGGDDGKQISNPFSTGNGGSQFEIQVMSAFATLMLAGCYAPCLRPLPIRSIKLQGRHLGYQIDDFIVHVADASQTDKRRLLAQVKHGISFTKSSTQFRDTIAAAWKDYNDPVCFTPDRDAIAIIAGPLSAADIEDTRTILEWARSEKSPHAFFEKVEKTNFSSVGKQQKLAAFRAQSDAAAGKAVSDEDLFEFLRHVHVLGFDLDVYSGLTHALMHGIIGRHSPENPVGIWARIFEHVSSFNQNAGTLTVDSFPEDVQSAFKPRPVETIPPSLTTTVPPKAVVDWNSSEFGEALVIANLVGGWSEGSDADTAVVAALLMDKPDEWLRKMREVLQHPESPLSYADGVWAVGNHAALWTSLAGRIFDQTLKRFETCALTVLRERDPKFDLDPEQRYAAQIYGKVTAHSRALRSGVVETLALLGINAAPLPNCSLSAGEAIAPVVVRQLLHKADWELWASLDRLLSTLAEAAPTSFLDAIEKALQQQPCPFDPIFAQERGVMSGGTYMSGLLWGLEALAWDESYLVRVSIILAMLAARDPGGTWTNRPSNSLRTIFLPWLPQTRASVDKRAVAVKAVVQERRAVGWRLLMKLLPKQHSTSSGTQKPKWRNRIESDNVPRPTTQEYWTQVFAYAQMAVEIVLTDPDKLTELIDSLDSLPEPALNEVLAFIASETVSGLTDEQRLPIWTKLSSFARKHRKYADAEWALPAEIVSKIEDIASILVPENPTLKYRLLFANNSLDLYDDATDWQKSAERLAQRQIDAVREIFENFGIDGVASFATHVEKPFGVGFSLGEIGRAEITDQLLPKLILSVDPKLRQLVYGFVWAWWQHEQWDWFDKLNKATWSKDEVAQVLIYLPFGPETWRRAEQLLGEGANEYWTRIPVDQFRGGDDDYVAVDALLKHGRPRAAVVYLELRVNAKLPLDPDRAIDALLASVSSNEPDFAIDQHTFATVIKALQDNKAADRKKLMTVEWAYLALLEYSQVTTAKTLSAALAGDPGLFCDIIRRLFRSDHDLENETSLEIEAKSEPSPDEQAIGQSAYRLLHGWTTVPGTDATGFISGVALTAWIDAVKAFLGESGHLDIGLYKAGEVFINAPGDPDGLFIHTAVANVLNREDMEELRRGYELALYNSRGARIVDPTGAPEVDLAKNYSQKAETIENEGYHRLAITFRSIADHYKRDAERIKRRFGNTGRPEENP